MLFHLAEPAVLLGIALGVVVGVYLHDVAQVLAAAATHDPMARRAGRLGLRPASHLGIYSAVAVVVVGYGWSEPVPMNDRWRSRRLVVAAALLAGPAMLALLCLAALAGLRLTVADVAQASGNGLAFGPRVLLWTAFTLGALFIVSLIPLGPTDGARLLWLLGGTSYGWQKARYQLEERNIGLGILLGLLLLPVFLGGFPSVVGQLVAPLLRGLGALVGLTLP